MGYLRKLKYIWGAKFIAHLPKKYNDAKTMSETGKNIAPEVTNAALKEEKVSIPDAKVETSK
jgi:hypothetical protein